MKEATVHFSAVVWPSGEDAKHFCETCYPEAEAQRTASYGPKGKPLPVVDVERIKASEYLDFAARAHANSVDAPAYRHISQELKRFPATRERLAVEMLTMARESLANGNEAWDLIGLGSCFGKSAGIANTQAMAQLLEKIVLRSVELMAQSANRPSAHPFGFGLTMAGNALRWADPGRFSMLVEGLEGLHGDSLSVRAVLVYLEQQMAESEQHSRKKRDHNV